MLGGRRVFGSQITWTLENLRHISHSASLRLLRKKHKQLSLAEEHSEKRAHDVEHCKRQLEHHVLPFFAELKENMGDEFSYSHQIDIHDHKPVGVSFRIGDGSPVTITTAFGNIIVARRGHQWHLKGHRVCLPAGRRTIYFEFWGSNARKDGQAHRDDDQQHWPVIAPPGEGHGTACLR